MNEITTPPVDVELKSVTALTLTEAMQRGIPYTEWLLAQPEAATSIMVYAKDALLKAEASRLVAQLKGKAFTPPEVLSLDEALTVEREPLVWRIEHCMVVGHNTTIAASYKVGKTTLLLNRVKSYVDGTPFLDAFEVKPANGNVVVFNYEVGDGQFVGWLDSIGIKNQRQVVPVNLRGKNLWIQDDDACEWVINLLRERECEIWEVDPMSAAIRGNTMSEEVASDFLGRLDRIKDEAGVSELVLTTHTGHLTTPDANGRSQNERTAGSARFMGWPDNLWTYVKDTEEHRYLSMMGRDVEVAEFQVSLDKDTKTLTSLGRGTSRVAGKDMRLWTKMLRTVEAQPGISASDLANIHSKHSDVTRLRKEAVEMGIFEERKGEKAGAGPKPTNYFLTNLGKGVVQRLQD